MRDDAPYTDDEAPPGDNVHPLRPAALNNPEAERALLGAILTQPTLAPDLHDHLDPDDFYDPRHEQIWDAIYTVLHRDGVEPDHIMVTNQLRQTGELTKIGGTYLPQLILDCPTPNQAHHYAALVRNASRLRHVDTAATHLRHLAATATPDTVDTALAETLQTLDTIAARTGTRNTGTPGLRDLTWLLAGDPPTVQPPTYIRRGNGEYLFYPGRVNGIYGDPESAKSWLAQMGIVQTLAEGGRVALIDVDHNGAQLTTERLILLGATREQLADQNHFRYLEPEDGPDLRAAVIALTRWAPHYVVLDSIGEMMPMLGIKSVDNDELSGALRTIATPFALAGACVVTIDHLPKSTDARATGFAIGGTAKKRAIDGAYIHAEARMPPAPGHIGKITLRIEKDRPGRLRATCTGKFLGTLTLDSRDHEVIASIDNDSPVTTDGIFRPTVLMERISRYVEDNDQCTWNAIREDVTGNQKHLKTAVTRLLDEGFLAVLDGPNKSKLHHSIATYREADDDQPT